MTGAGVPAWEPSPPALRPRPGDSLVILLLTQRLSAAWPPSVCSAW